ncbi:hypothetical protein O181_080613 [Austropuccinia psidii MF-1]|uniref:Uncharacterized protein n=1 Tax=Austropuccinia psidii MF-1 TaxID=1389203 RepID=A0A9Q3FN75_9BASI|nr:hypothetical protein [Austropuccinia psidii MF-1]
MTKISSKRKFKPSKNQAKKKICEAFQLAPEVNEGESKAICPSANESNNGHPMNTKNDHRVEIPEIGGVTNHHENNVPSPNLDTQEATPFPMKISVQKLKEQWLRMKLCLPKQMLTHKWILLLVH